MKNLLLTLCLLIPSVCYAEKPNYEVMLVMNEKGIEPQVKLKVVNTFIQLAYYNPQESLRIIDAIENRSKECEQFGATFVKDAYANNATELNTTDCKIIWKAILVTCRTNQDGFELMDIPTPWIKQ